jgi:hypothetical protein
MSFARSMAAFVVALFALSCGSSDDAESPGAAAQGGTSGGGAGGALGDGSVLPGTDAGGRADTGGSADASGDAAATACTPNQTVKCTCATGLGSARCSPKGTGLGACDCPAYATAIEVTPTSAGGLDAARDSARAKRTDAGTTVVWLHGGVYPQGKTFALDDRDSGIVYRGYPGEVARIVGGETLDPAWFTPSTNARLDPSVQGKVVEVDLKAHGITDYGTLLKRGFCGSNDAALELFIDGAPMTLARWPDASQNDITAQENADQVQIYGTLTPDVTGVYAKDATQDGVSSFSRQGLVGGKQYHLYRYTWTYQGSKYTAWFLTTNASGYPAATDPFWSNYNASLGAMNPSQGAVGTPTTRAPDAVDHGFVHVAATSSDTTFQYLGDRPSRWTSAPDPWLHGYWMYAWADCREPSVGIDTATRTITLKEKPGYGIAAGQPFYAYNLLEEITEPGEWYLDRTTGILYLYPPGDLSKSEIVVSTLAAPLVSVTGASHVRIMDVTLEAGRSELVDVSGGTDVVLEGVTLRNAGTDGAVISGTENGIRSCLVYGTGNGGIRLSGGDRPTLVSGGNFVENCDIHHFGRWEWTYRPGVSMNDVGNRAAHNEIHDAPHSAILYGGNEHLIELNDVHDVCRFSSDAGAIYAGRDWGARGNKIRHNFVHDIATSFEGYGVHGVYLDDCLSGIEVSGNVIYRVQNLGILHGGGRDNIMVNNLIVECGTGLGADKRGYDWFKAGNGPSHVPGDSWNLLEKLEKVGYQQDPWKSRYPECAAIPDSYAAIEAPTATWLYPEGCVFSRNIGWKNGTWVSGTDATAYYKEQKDDVADQDPVFKDEANLDLSLTAGSPALAIPGWEPIPFDQIGIRP